MHMLHKSAGGVGLMTWGPHIGFKDTPEGVFEATEAIDFISHVLWK